MDKPLLRDSGRLGKPVGRPPKYDKVDSLIDDITQYFEKHGDEPTLGEFALALGLTYESLHIWLNNESNPEIFKPLRIAKQRIINTVEKKLVYGKTSPIGSIFWLKNISSDQFKDKQELETKGTNDLTINVVDFATKRRTLHKPIEDQESIETNSSEIEE